MGELKKIAATKEIKFSDVAQQIRKLEYQKSLLETAYAKGYIRSNSYREGKKKINALVNKLKKRL